MPILAVTIEDSSPAITYSERNGYPDWQVGSSETDSSLDSYSENSYMVTNLTQASVEFTFYGTGVQLFGSKRQSHGQYQVSLDAIVYPPANGQVNDTQGQFQTQLFSTVALKADYHTVKMVNLGPGQLDLDFVTWQIPIGEVDDQLKTITLQDADSAFSYTPVANWFTTPSNLGTFSGGTGQFMVGVEVQSKVPVLADRPSLIVGFQGDAIALYGPITPKGATYSVFLDDGAAQNHSSLAKSVYKPQQLLYQAANLEGKEHTLRIVPDAAAGSEFIVDYALVHTTDQLEASGGSLSKGAIVGIAVGSFLGLVLIALTIFLCIRFWSKYRKYAKLANQSRSDPEIKNSIEPYEQRPVSYTGTATSHSGLLPATSFASLGNRHHSVQTSSGQTVFTPPGTATSWTPPPGTHIIYSNSAEPIVAGPNTQVITIPFTPEGKYRPDLQTPHTAPPPPESTVGTSSEYSSSGLGSQSGHGAVLPPGAQAPMPYIPEEARRTTSIESAGASSRNASPAPAPLQPLRPGASPSGMRPRTPPGYQVEPTAY